MSFSEGNDKAPRPILRRPSAAFQESQLSMRNAALNILSGNDSKSLESVSSNSKELQSNLNAGSDEGQRGLGQQLRWDEEAIRLHDTERGTRMKIDEPKTPFTYYDSSGEELDNGCVTASDLADALSKRQDLMESSNNEMSLSDNNISTFSQHGKNHDFGENSRKKEPAFSSLSEMETADPAEFFMSDGMSSVRRSTTFSDEVNDGSDEGSHEDIEKRRKFNNKRSDHYNMKEALQRARWKRERTEAMSEESADGEDEGEKKSASRREKYMQNSSSCGTRSEAMKTRKSKETRKLFDNYSIPFADGTRNSETESRSDSGSASDDEGDEGNKNSSEERWEDSQATPPKKRDRDKSPSQKSSRSMQE